MSQACGCWRFLIDIGRLKRTGFRGGSLIQAGRPPCGSTGEFPLLFCFSFCRRTVPDGFQQSWRSSQDALPSAANSRDFVASRIPAVIQLGHGYTPMGWPKAEGAIRALPHCSASPRPGLRRQFRRRGPHCIAQTRCCRNWAAHRHKATLGNFFASSGITPFACVCNSIKVGLHTYANRRLHFFQTAPP